MYKIRRFQGFLEKRRADYGVRGKFHADALEALWFYCWQNEMDEEEMPPIGFFYDVVRCENDSLLPHPCDMDKWKQYYPD